MNKLTTFVAVMAAAGLATLKVMEDAPPPPKISAEVTSFDDETTERVITYRCFKDTLESSLQALARGKISLAEATLRVQCAAGWFCPMYLDRIRIAEEGTTPNERVARNLLGHLYSQEELDPHLEFFLKKFAHVRQARAAAAQEGVRRLAACLLRAVEAD